MIRNEGEASFDDDLRAFLDVLPDLGAGRLQLLREVAFGARALLDLEAERLADRVELAERVIDLRAAAAVRLELADALDAEAEAAGIRVPETNPAESLVHGRVVDPRLRGLANLRARLVDENGRDVPDVQPVATDAAGYYAFVLPANLAKRLEDKPVSVVFDAGGEALAPAETERVTLKPGSAVFREVAVPGPIVDRLRPTLRPEVLRPRTEPPAGGEAGGSAAPGPRPGPRRKRKG